MWIDGSDWTHCGLNRLTALSGLTGLVGLIGLTGLVFFLIVLKGGRARAARARISSYLIKKNKVKRRTWRAGGDDYHWEACNEKKPKVHTHTKRLLKKSLD